MFHRLGIACGLLAILPSFGCASLPSLASSPSRPKPSTADHSLAYEVAIAPDASSLVVEANVPAGVPPYFGMATGAVAYVSDLHVRTVTNDWRRVATTDTFYFLPDCVDTGCTIRYRFALREAARTLRDVDRAMLLAPDLVEAPPSTWLLRPIGLSTGTYRLQVTPIGGVRFATGLFPAPPTNGALDPLSFRGNLAQLVLAPYTVFGRFELETVTDASRNVGLHVAVPRALSERKEALRSWALRSAQSVGDYYGSFPVPHALVVVAPREGTRVTHGRTLGNGGASSVVWVGDHVGDESLKNDWVLRHELVHMALPSVEEDHRWFEEGVATYVENMARAASDEGSEEAFWRSLLDGLPKGLPHRGDRGLDHTPTWGRRYWGGALFCFLADMEIRKRTDGRASLADALRGIAQAGGNVSVGWSLKRTLATGDAAVGTTVLRELHDRMGERPMPVDLGALWSRLGVSVEGGRVVLDDAAPASELRRSLAPRSDETRSDAVGDE